MSSPVPPSSTNGQGPPERTNGSIESLLYDEPGRADGSQLRELAALLWGGKWIILGALVVAVAAGWAYTYSIPTTYQTSSLVLVDRQNSQMIAGLGGATARRAMGQEDRQLQNELLVLRQSMTIANRVADRLRAMETHPRTGQPLRILTGPEGTQRSHAQVARQVKGIVSARQTGEGVDALSLVASGRDPREVALVVNLYAEEYVARTREKSRESTQAKLNFLQTQADTLRAQLDVAERRIETYMQEEGAVALDQETQRVVSRISDLEAERQQLQIELDMTRATIAQQEEELNEVTPKLAARLSSVTQSRLSQVQEEKAQLQARIDQIQRENPSLDSPALRRDLKRLRARKAALAQEADSLAQRYVDEALSAGGVSAGGEEGGGGQGIAYVTQQRRELAQQRIEASGLEARLATLDDQLAEARTTLQEIPSQSMELAQLQRNRSSTERIYGFVREQLQETRLAMQSEQGYAEVIRQAGPGVPVSPDTRQNLILAALLGLVAGGGLVVLRDKLDTKIHQPSDLRDRGHRLLGAVPSMEGLIETEFDGAETVTIDDRPVATSLVMLTSPMSAAAEGYRRVRTNLQFTRPDTGLQTVMVSSPDQGDGKTTTATNVALAFAGAGQDTILVDADLRRPRLHDFLHVDREPGLSHALYTEDPDWSVFESSIDRLSILPAGVDVPNPAELLGSQRMEALMARLRAQYDYVIVDTPPVLLFSDVLGLGPQCDGTLLVAAADRTDGRAFDHAVEMLSDVDIPVVGAVLNGFDPSQGIRAYSYNYGYAYGYRRMADYYEEGSEPTGTAWFRS